MASKAPIRLHKALLEESGGKVLENDYEALQGKFEDVDIKMAGTTVLLSPNEIRIERIPFKIEDYIRGYFA